MNHLDMTVVLMSGLKIFLSCFTISPLRKIGIAVSSISLLVVSDEMNLFVSS